jgi:hypothetical protein
MVTTFKTSLMLLQWLFLLLLLLLGLFSITFYSRYQCHTAIG